MNQMRQNLDKSLFFSMLSFFAGMIVWLGSLIFFGIGVAMIIFKVLPTKDLAGMLNAAILHRLNMLELLGATLIGISIVLLWQRSTKQEIMRSVGILILMMVFWCGYALILTSEMNTLRSQINSFDAPSVASLPLVQQFRSLHVWYSRLVSGNILFGMILFVLQVRFYLKLNLK